MLQPLPVSAQVGAQVRAVTRAPALVCGKQAAARHTLGSRCCLPSPDQSLLCVVTGGRGLRRAWPPSRSCQGRRLASASKPPLLPVTGCIALIRTLTPLDVGQTVVITLTGSTVETGDEIRHTTRLAEVRQQWLIGFFRTIGYGNPGSLCSRALTWGSLNHRFPGNAGDRPAATSKD